MDFKGLTFTILAVTVPIIAVFILQLIRTLIDNINNKTDNANINIVLGLLENIVNSTIDALPLTTETLIKDYLSDGIVTEEEFDDIVEHITDDIVRRLPDAVFYADVIEDIASDFEEYIKTIVIAKVKQIAL